MRIFTIIFLFTLSFHAYSTCSNDSTVVKFSHNTGYSESKLVETSTFHLDSGSVDICTSRQFESDPWTTTCTRSYWSRTSTFTHGNGILDSSFTQTGTPSGWVNTVSILNSYNSSGLIATSMKRNWNGSAWENNTMETSVYDSHNRITEIASYYFTSGIISNLERKIYTYSASGLIQIDFEYGNGTLWKMQKQYLIGYTGSQRTTLDVNKWDDSLQALIPSGHYNYDYQFGPLSVCIKDVHTDTSNGTMNLDTSYVVIDTLENILVEHSVSVSGGPDFYEGDYTNNTFVYINGIRCQTHEFSSMAYYDILNGDTSAEYDCATNVYYTFDTFGRATSWDDHSRCGNPRGATGYETYNTDNSPNFVHGEGWSMVSDWNNDIWYQYYGRNVFRLLTPPWQNDYHPCKGNMIVAETFPIGGCPSYSYHWSPSTGLSNDTIQNPSILVNDPINYTVTVMDNNGNSNSENYSVTPFSISPISIDTVTCAGCLATLHADDFDYTSYQWYLNNTPVQNAYSSTLQVSDPGSYFIEVHNYELNCIVISDPVYISNSFLSVNGNTFTICSGEHITLTANGASSYSWLPGNLTTQSIDVSPATSAQYIVYGTDTAGIVDSVIIEVVVNAMPDIAVTVNGNFLLSNQSNVQYQWIDCDNNMSPLINENDQGYVAITNGSYAVILNNNGCTDTSACYLILPSNIEKENSDNNNLIYPNPVISKLNYDSNSEKNECRYYITDYSGRIVQRGEINEGKNVIDTDKLTTGIYFFFTIGNEYRCFRFLKD